MKTILTSILTTITASGLFATLALAQTPRYNITDLGTLGGTFGSAYAINYEGRVAGAGTLANGNTHAFLTGFPGALYDLGTLGGPNSNEGGLNASYQMAILAETSQKDPLGENFCGFGTPYICLAAIWNGTMTPLPTLGGNNGLAFAINDRGQVAGAAENSTKDPKLRSASSSRFRGRAMGAKPGPSPGTPAAFRRHRWIRAMAQQQRAGGWLLGRLREHSTGSARSRPARCALGKRLPHCSWQPGRHDDRRGCRY